ncbi:MAG: glycosyltransferase [Bacteroidales bacterium]|nr:glycosyltransferase [Bacteroidales bacterium]
MRLLINTANLRVGGAWQRSISFIEELKKFPENEYFIYYTDELKKHINISLFPENFNFYHFERSPARLLSRRGIVKKFNRLEKKIIPDLVFSFVGPAYWRPRSIHLVGFGIPHIVYSEYRHVKELGLKDKLAIWYKKQWTKKEADYYVVQTGDVKNRLAEKANVPNEKIFIVSNGYGSQYDNFNLSIAKKEQLRKLLLISTYRKNKNIDIINDLIIELKKRKFQCEFHITIDDEVYEQVFSGNESWVKNHGHVPSAKGPELYSQCDAMFLPTLLECFSASYPEAMRMEIPILTSDYSFATSICGDAALYFDPYDVKDMAEKIIQLYSDDKLYKSLIVNGLKRLEAFDNPEVRTRKYLEICRKLISNNNTKPA